MDIRTQATLTQYDSSIMAGRIEGSGKSKSYLVECPLGALTVGRGRKGDENTPPYILCGYFKLNDDKGRLVYSTQVLERNTSAAMWSDANLSCSEDQAIMDWYHTSDENGETYVRCAILLRDDDCD